MTIVTPEKQRKEPILEDLSPATVAMLSPAEFSEEEVEVEESEEMEVEEGTDEEVELTEEQREEIRKAEEAVEAEDTSTWKLW